MKKLKWLSLLGMVCMALFVVSACGDDKEEATPNQEQNNNNNSQKDNQNQNQEDSTPDASNWAEFLVGEWYTVYADADYIDSRGNHLTAKRNIDPSLEADWPFYNRFIFGQDYSFNGWSINYNGSGDYRGREEQTFLGKYTFDDATRTALLYDLVMGYHEVINFKNGNQVEKTKMPINITSLTETEMVYTVQGMGTYKMAKKTK